MAKNIRDFLKNFTAKNNVISPDFLVRKFCGKAQLQSESPETAETVHFGEISTPGNQVKLRYFSQCLFEYYFLIIILNITFFCDLNITMNTTLKY